VTPLERRNTHCVILLVALSAIAPALDAQAPKYTLEGIYNSASWEAGNLAPYTFATIFGEKLADNEKSRGEEDGIGGIGSVDVLVNGIAARVFYISPTQVNFLLPMRWKPGDVGVRVVNRGIAGPEVTLKLREYAPALFQLDSDHVVAQRWPGYIVATPEAPAHPGEIVVLYAAGLGSFESKVTDDAPPWAPQEIAARKDFRLLLDNVPVDDDRIWYAGAVDQYWGLYQINLLLPESVPDNPVIQIAIGDHISRPELRLPLRAQ
jgi:uncharacterized protein (TIGR03437 family)